MAIKRLKRPRDPIQLAKLIGDIATGQVIDEVEDGKNPAAVELGRRGGLARAAAMHEEARVFQAKKAVNARWAKKKAKSDANKK